MLKITAFLLCLFTINGLFGQVDPVDVEIIRDKWGVPHIYATTDAGVAYGLAWAHAEDDFETIQLPLISGKQMLGRYLGKEGAAIDYVVSLLRLEKLAKKQWAEFTPEFQKIVLAYRDAINAFAQKYPERVLLKGVFPISEFDLVRTYALSLSVVSGVDATLKSLFGGEVGAESKPEGGSNAIALARTKTADDYVYLAVNSHQPLEGPVAWYEAHLVSDEGWNMMGGLFPGSPVVLHGTNEKLGWAHTVNFPDRIDIYELEINPNNSNQYKLDGRWKDLEVQEVKLKVKVFLGLKITVKREVFWSDFGPVVKNENGTYAFHVGTLEDAGALEQWYFMNKANSMVEFKNALSMMSLPMYNVVYADREGNIYHLGNGKIPFREKGYDWTEVVKGNSSDLLPKGYHPLDDLPQNLNPESGFIYNVNNSVYSSSSPGNNPDSTKYDKTMGYTYWENNRSVRFKELVNKYESLFYEDFKRIKYDLTLPDSLHYPIDINGVFSINRESMSEKASVIQGYLIDWNRAATIDALGPAHAIMFYSFLNDKLKVKYREYYRASESDMNQALERTYDYFMENFGRVDIRLGDFQFLVRGKQEVPIQGISDVLAAMYSVPYEDGKYKAAQGESYIMLVRYPKEGLPLIETVNVYGASNVPTSAHYDDQMSLFLKQELKPMTLDIEKVRQEAERIYHPR